MPPSSTVEPTIEELLTIMPASPIDGKQSQKLPVAVRPRVDLADGQVVTVLAKGFLPGERVGVVMCVAEAALEGVDACDLGPNGTFDHVADTDASPEGFVQLDVAVRPAIVTPFGGPVDCASGPERCVVAVGAVGDYDRSGGAPVGFAGQPPFPETTLRVAVPGPYAPDQVVDVAAAGLLWPREAQIQLCRTELCIALFRGRVARTGRSPRRCRCRGPSCSPMAPSSRATPAASCASVTSRCPTRPRRPRRRRCPSSSPASTRPRRRSPRPPRQRPCRRPPCRPRPWPWPCRRCHRSPLFPPRRADAAHVARFECMAVYLCHEQPDLYEHGASVIDAAPGRVLLDRSAFHPGGGGQVADAGTLEHAGGIVTVIGVDVIGDAIWHVLDDPAVEVAGDVVVRIDAARRSRVAQLHTDSHVLNAIVYDRWPGTLVTGAQINADGTGRMDFDLSEVDNDALRALDAAVNDVIGRGPDVRAVYVDAGDATTVAGLVRSLSVAPPPTPDGMLRIIEIDGVDRQACGGTHLTNPGSRRPSGSPRSSPRASATGGSGSPWTRRQRFGPLGRFSVMDGGRDRVGSDFVERFEELFAVGYRAGYAVLGRRAEAEDCAQEAIARALARWSRIEDYAAAWVARVATNLALDRVRKLERQRRHEQRPAVLDDPVAANRHDLVAALRRCRPASAKPSCCATSSTCPSRTRRTRCRAPSAPSRAPPPAGWNDSARPSVRRGHWRSDELRRPPRSRSAPPRAGGPRCRRSPGPPAAPAPHGDGSDGHRGCAGRVSSCPPPSS